MLVIVLFFFSIVTCSLLTTRLLHRSNPRSPKQRRHRLQQQFATAPVLVSTGRQGRDAHEPRFLLDKQFTTSSGRALDLNGIRAVLLSVNEDQVDECQELLSSSDYYMDEQWEVEAALCPESSHQVSLRHSWTG